MTSRMTTLIGIAATLASCSRGDTALETAAETAAAEFHVPAQLLIAIANAE